MGKQKKIVQTESFRVVAFGNDKALSIILAHRSQPLQYSDRTIAKVQAELLRQQGREESIGAFDRHGRCTCTDRYAPNYSGETEVCEEAGDYNFHRHCEGHMCGTGMGLQRDAMKAEVVGIAAYPKAMRAKGEMSYLRRSVCKGLWQILDVCPVALTREAVFFKELVFNCTLSMILTCKLCCAGLRLVIGEARDLCFLQGATAATSIRHGHFCAKAPPLSY